MGFWLKRSPQKLRLCTRESNVATVALRFAKFLSEDVDESDEDDELIGAPGDSVVSLPSRQNDS
jgi:hypothetical protein